MSGICFKIILCDGGVKLQQDWLESIIVEVGTWGLIILVCPLLYVLKVSIIQKFKREEKIKLRILVRV